MNQLRSRYTYDTNKPLRKPHRQENKVYNGYYKGFDTLENKNVLISEYSTSNLAQLEALAKRIGAIKEIKHKNLAEIYEIGVFSDQCLLILVLEWCEGGSILDYMQKEMQNKEKPIKLFLDYQISIKIICEIMEGVQAIHAKNIVHRSINLENIQIKSDGVAKLTVKCLIYKNYYLSPQEKQKNSQKSKENDIFSLGISLYRLIYGGSPFKSQSLQVYTEAVKKGPKFIAKSKLFLPIEIPTSVKHLLTIMLNVQPEIRNQCYSKIKQFQPLRNNGVSQNKSLLGNQYIQIYKNKDSSQQTNITVLKIHEKEIYKMVLYKGDPNTIQQYVQNVTTPYIAVQNKQFINIQEQKPKLTDKYIMILLDYDNQGSLKEYYELRKDNFDIQTINEILAGVNSSLQKLQTPYLYLSNQTIKIHKGQALLSVPPFPTKQFNQILRNKRKQIDFIAPEVKEGKSSNSSDSWSVGVLQYWMMFKMMPSYDENLQQLFIPNRERLSSQVIKQLELFLEQNPSQRQSQTKNRIPPTIITSFQQQEQFRNHSQASPRRRKQSEQNKKLSPRSPSKISNFQVSDQNMLRLKDTSNEDFSNMDKMDGEGYQRQQNLERQVNKRNEGNSKNENHLKKPPLPIKKTISTTPQQTSKIGQKIYDTFSFTENLQKSWTKPIRISLKCFIALLLYIFLFYFSFLQNTGRLISQRSTFQPYTVRIRTFETDTIASVNYTLVTRTPISTNQLYSNSTVIFLRDKQQCALNNYGGSSNIVSILVSRGFGVYLVFGILLGILNIFFICFTLSKMDFPKAFSLCTFEDNKLSPLLNFLFVQLAISSLTCCIYLIYGSLFHLTTQPCFRKPLLPSLEYLLKGWINSFCNRFILVYIGMIIAYSVIIYIVLFPGKSNHKIFYFVIIVLYLIGVGGRAMGGYVSGSESLFGVFGELLCLINGIIFLTIDFVFGICLKKKKQLQPKKEDHNNNNNRTTQVFIFQEDDQKSDL